MIDDSPRESATLSAAQHIAPPRHASLRAATQHTATQRIETRSIVNREEWLGWREKDITASDIGALCGCSPFKSRLQVWCEKTGRAPKKSAETLLMRRGRWLEPAVLTALAETCPHETVTKLSVYLRDPILRLGATPDALLGSRRLIEAKVVARPVFETWEDVPLAYKLQAATGAMLMDASAAIIACLVIDTYSAELHLFHVERIAEAEQKIRDDVAAFWRMVEAGEMPQADYGEDGELLSSLYRPKEFAEPIDLSTDNLLPELLIEREGLSARIKADESRVQAIRAELIDKLRGAPAAICGPWTITHSVQRRAERIQPASESMVLRVRKRQEEAA